MFQWLFFGLQIVGSWVRPLTYLWTSWHHTSFISDNWLKPNLVSQSVSQSASQPASQPTNQSINQLKLKWGYLWGRRKLWNNFVSVSVTVPSYITIKYDLCGKAPRVMRPENSWQKAASSYIMMNQHLLIPVDIFFFVIVEQKWDVFW
jgi:hypothetical protein